MGEKVNSSDPKNIPLILHAHGDNVPSWTNIIDYILSKGIEMKDSS